MKNRKSDDARDTFPKVGDYDDAENVSGAPWPGFHLLLRDRTITAPPPGQHVSSRTAKIITANSGEKLDADLARSLTAAAQRHLTIRETVDQSHPSARPMLEHLFGLNLGRDRDRDRA